MLLVLTLLHKAGKLLLVDDKIWGLREQANANRGKFSLKV